MFDSILEFMNHRQLNHTKKYKEIIKEYYNRQYVYCETCIRTQNKQCKMTLCISDNKETEKDNEKEDCFGCFNCYSSIPLSNIKDDNYIFDNEELKEYILKDDSYYKIKCLLIYWKQPKRVICSFRILNDILNDIKQDNFHTLFQYDPSYIPV